MCLEFKRSNFIPGGFSEFLALSAGHLKHTAFPVPDTVSDEEASCTEPLACVLRAYRRTRGLPLSRQSSSGQSVLVVGLGFIGLLAAQAYAYAGELVYGAEVDQTRLDWALSQGSLRAASVPERQSSERPQEISQPVDTVFLTVVNEATLRLAFASVRDGGQILLFASPASGNPDVMLNPDVLYFRELTVLTSYSPALQDLRLASELIFSQELPMRATVSETVPIHEITQAMERYRSGNARKVFVQMSVEADGSENHVNE
jgi:L-iditol 2-dehydrogenase